ncbi:hypothetical protein DBZ36_11040 [Alginatibacterium sediminis]|uniref:Uncharacterized protein n=1 Tax=Alginatibacterium sediminis TaxID=2164068 RepID=A0A420EAU2_9ALTE|nr:hypothetical protein [Alginatibacterium sediminis]RKF17791.1 hypothetical protein DBZ36_11040 [Alginatibacterium sediminis]
MSNNKYDDYYRSLGISAQLICEYPNSGMNLFEAYSMLRHAINKQLCFILLNAKGDGLGLIVWSTDQTRQRKYTINLLVAPYGDQLALLEKWQSHLSISQQDFVIDLTFQGESNE